MLCSQRFLDGNIFCFAYCLKLEVEVCPINPNLHLLDLLNIWIFDWVPWFFFLLLYIFFNRLFMVIKVALAFSWRLRSLCLTSSIIYRSSSPRLLRPCAINVSGLCRPRFNTTSFIKLLLMFAALMKGQDLTSYLLHYKFYKISWHKMAIMNMFRDRYYLAVRADILSSSGRFLFFKFYTHIYLFILNSLAINTWFRFAIILYIYLKNICMSWS